MIPPRGVIIGTGRSGTGYTAALMRRAGARWGHEWHFRLRKRTSGLDGDSSWLALPEIESGDWSGPTVHVVRHPVDVVRSLVGIRFFHDEQARAPFPRFAREHCPEVRGLAPLDAAVEWWATWNARCAAVADRTLRLEDLPDAPALPQLAEPFGVMLDARSARRVSTSTNHWDDHPEVDAGAVWERLDGRAEQFGYTP